MFNIKVWCLPQMEPAACTDLFKKIVATVAGIKGMAQAGYTDEKTVLVLFPADMMSYGLGSEILIEVRGLANIRTIDNTTRLMLCEKLGLLLHREFQTAHVVCNIIPTVENEVTWFNDVGFVNKPVS